MPTKHYGVRPQRKSTNRRLRECVMSRVTFAALVILCMTSANSVMGQTTRTVTGSTPIAAPTGLTTPGAEWVKIQGSNGHAFVAAIFRPQGVGPFPVVVVLPGASGL